MTDVSVQATVSTKDVGNQTEKLTCLFLLVKTRKQDEPKRNFLRNWRYVFIKQTSVHVYLQ